MEVNNLLDIFEKRYYTGIGIMEDFSKLFKQHMRVYLYPRRASHFRKFKRD